MWKWAIKKNVKNISTGYKKNQNDICCEMIEIMLDRVLVGIKFQESVGFADTANVLTEMYTE